MATKEIRQRARRDARDLLARKRRERLEQEKTRDALAVQVMAALAERQALIVDAERRAGTALQALVRTGLSLTEAARWCDGVQPKDAARLIRLAQQHTEQQEDPDDDAS